MTQPPTPPSWLVEAAQRGEKLRCETGLHLDRIPPEAHFYCPTCEAVRCGLCIRQGACIGCGKLVRTVGALLLHAKEKRL